MLLGEQEAMQSSKAILVEVDAEIARLKQARKLLADDGYISTAKAAPGITKRKKKKKSVMSEEGRKRIAEAQKKRWARNKKTSK
jgi:hypothetical protein